MSKLTWQTAIITRITTHSQRFKSFELHLEQPFNFKAGEHCAIRISFADGHQIARDYSLSSAPSSGIFEVTVERIDTGEVSGWFFDDATVGSSCEIIGPVGGFETALEYPLLLVAGNAGVTPMLSIIREHKLTKARHDIVLLWSVSTTHHKAFDETISDILTLRVTNGNHKKYLQAHDFTPFVGASRIVCVAGSDRFIENMRSELYKAGFSYEQVFSEALS
jgi:ferredoxin-NADP reductase